MWKKKLKKAWKKRIDIKKRTLKWRNEIIDERENEYVDDWKNERKIDRLEKNKSLKEKNHRKISN